MKKEHFICSALVAAFIVMLFFVIPGGALAADPIKLNYSIFFPAPHKNTVLANEWAQEIEKRTNGAVKITIFAGGTCIEDFASLQNSEGFRNLVGACRVPDPTTAGDFLRRFDTHSLGVMDAVLDDGRARVWRMLPRQSRRRATVDLDSTIKPVYVQCKQGADFS